jgi:hypothetical protein
VHHSKIAMPMSLLGQKCPKRVRLPAGRSPYEHMGRIVPNPDIGELGH